MKIDFGFSPCPNDTVQFYGMVHGRVDTHGLQFAPRIADVEELNRLALAGALPLTKVSYGVVGGLLPKYLCLRSGGALGRGVGPLWVSSRPADPEYLLNWPIAHPGVNTTAFLLLELRAGRRVNGVPMIFSEVMDAVEQCKAVSGVIIHEGRFTYQSRGLSKILDLGEWWETTVGGPIPLGAIVMKRDLGVEPGLIDSIIRASQDYAKQNPDEVWAWVKANAQEMDDEVIKKHIALYVNDFSRDIGEEGEKAVRELIRRGEEIGRYGKFTGGIFG